MPHASDMKGKAVLWRLLCQALLQLLALSVGNERVANVPD